jgi:chromosome segregation ATPase
LQDERDRLRQKLKSVEDSGQSAVAQLSTRDKHISALQDKNKELSEAKQSSEKEVGRLRKQVKGLESRLDKEGSGRAALDTRVVELQRRIAQVEADSEAVKADALEQVLLLISPYRSPTHRCICNFLNTSSAVDMING